MYSPDDIVGFACAFYGCLFAGVVPVPIHPPIQKDVSFVECLMIDDYRLFGAGAYFNETFTQSFDKCPHSNFHRPGRIAISYLLFKLLLRGLFCRCFPQKVESSFYDENKFFIGCWITTNRIPSW